MTQADVLAVTQAVIAAMGGMVPAANQPQNVVTNAPQPVYATQTAFPIGVTGVDHRGIMKANSVNDLLSWEDHVQAADGGTHKGMKIMFISCDPTKKSDKSWSKREQYMARFEISRAGGRNPMCEVINIFMKDTRAYVPYLDPTKWSARNEEILFTSEDEDEPTRRAKLNMISFNGELISDDVHRKCTNMLSRLKGSYVYTFEGKTYGGEVAEGEE